MIVLKRIRRWQHVRLFVRRYTLCIRIGQCATSMVPALQQMLLGYKVMGNFTTFLIPTTMQHQMVGR
jgi:hypothetical protein